MGEVVQDWVRGQILNSSKRMWIERILDRLESQRGADEVQSKLGCQTMYKTAISLLGNGCHAMIGFVFRLS